MDNEAEIPTDIKICAMITLVCFIGMFIAISVGVYQKFTRPEPKDWRDGVREFKQTEKVWRDGRI
jgi:hypothetical protein